MRFASLAAVAALLIAAPALADEPIIPADDIANAVIDMKYGKSTAGPAASDPATIHLPSGSAGLRPPPSAKNSVPVTFKTGSADLTPRGQAQVDQIGRALTESSRLVGLHFRIEGHTDTTGSDQANMILSQQRAKAVVDYLVTHFALKPEQLQPVGMGKQGLAVPTPDQTPEPHNRRVVIIPVSS